MHIEYMTDNEDQDKKGIRKIKHISISGGAEWGFTGFGILYQAIECGFLHMDDINSMYMCSAGAIIGCMLSLKIGHGTIHDYLIKRPWETVCKKNKFSILDLYDSKGLIHRGFLENMFSPLLKSVDLDISITLSELYNYNGIDIHIFTTEVNQFITVDLSHTTHPEWRLIDAIYASSSVPIVFSPMIIGNECYMDSGILLNYPIRECISGVEDTNEVFGISLGNNYIDTEESRITDASNIFDVISTILSKVVKYNRLFSNDQTQSIPYQIHCLQNTTLDNCMNALYNRDFRKSLIYDGIERMKTEYAGWFPPV
jgi:predicted acylesterase/phospholipase RssA